MSEYDKIINEEKKLKKKLDELESKKIELENKVFLTFGKVYMDRNELKLEDFIGIEDDKLEEKVINTVNENMNFDNQSINYNYNNEK